MRGSVSRSLRALAAVALGVAAAFAAWRLSGDLSSLGRWLEPPAAGIRRALDRPPTGLLDVTGGATLRLDRLRFRDLLVTDRDGRARVVGLADADGALSWRGRVVAVAYLGRERLEADRCPGEGWCVEGGPVPRLTSLLSTLVRRADAFDDGDAGAYATLVAHGYQGAAGGRAELLGRLAADLAGRPRARMRPIAWQVRIERETAEVGEDYELTLGEGAPRRLRALLELREAGGRWEFTGGL